MAMDHTTGKPRLQLEIPKLSESIISVTAHSPAHTKVRHLSEDRPDTGCSFKGPDQLMSRPLLYTWMRCLDATLRPKLGDVYWWEEEQLTSLNTEKASYRARLILRVKSSGKDDCTMPWSSKMAFKKAAREDAVRRAMQSLQSLKSVSFADKENVNTRMRIKVF